MSVPFARGGGRADFELRVDLVALRAERLARAQAALRASPLDALLLWRDENVRYLTGLRAQIISGKSALLNGVFLADGRAPVLLCSGGEVDRVRAVMPWIEDARAIPIMEAAGLVREAVRGTLAPLRARGRRRSAWASTSAPTPRWPSCARPCPASRCTTATR